MLLSQVKVTEIAVTSVTSVTVTQFLPNPEQRSGKEGEEGEGGEEEEPSMIELYGVSLRYSPGEKYVLRGLSFKIQRREKVIRN